MVKLTQKRFLKGTRYFEIIDDTLYVREKTFLKESTLTVGLSTLNPEPVANGPEMVFYSSANNEPMLSLYINNPGADEFNAYIELLQRVIEKYNPYTGNEIAGDSPTQTLGWNVYDEPPDFDKADEQREIDFEPVNAERIAEDITMLKTYLDENDIGPLLEALETLKAEPDNEAALQEMIGIYKEMGINQGAVLTYATYVKVLLSKYIWS